MNKIPLIIDCDPGVDDAIAIMLANSAPNIDLIAVTPVSGNVSYEYTSKNVASLVSYIESDAIVARGSKKPLIFKPREDAASIHGSNGLLGIELPKRGEVRKTDKYAWDVFYEEAKKRPGEIVLCAVGPLTNVATAILKYPDLAKLLKKIVIMGGAYGAGNVADSPNAEYNIYIDPHACQILFNSGAEIVMVGLEACYGSAIDKNELLDIIKGDSRIKEFTDGMSASLSKEREIPKEAAEIIGDRFKKMAIFDAATVGGIIDDTLYKTQKCYVTCETVGENVGRTCVNFGSIHDDTPPNVNVALPADPDKFKALLISMMEFYRS